MRYLDFDLKIEGADPQFTARVLRSPGGEASHVFAMPFSQDKRENLVLRMTRLRTVTRRIESAEAIAARELGEGLYTAVFGPPVLACLQRSLERASREPGTGLRIRLRLQDVPELANLPWEFLRDPALHRFLAQSNRTPIVRYVEVPQSIEPLYVALPLRLLVVISSPTDYASLDVVREKETLLRVLEPLLATQRVEIEWLEEATLPALQRRLRTGQYHVFHFIGHGGFEHRTEEGVLVLADASGRGHLVPAHRLGVLLHDHSTLRLAVLNACEGARNSLNDPFAGVATTLIRDGIPAVIAMQFEISDESAICFAQEFYDALAQGLPVDAAVAEARKAIPSEIEWGTPVLYMRSADGVLFRLESPPAPNQPDTAPLAAPDRARQEDAAKVRTRRKAGLLKQKGQAEARAAKERKGEDKRRRRESNRRVEERAPEEEQRREAVAQVQPPPKATEPAWQAPAQAEVPAVPRPDCVQVLGGTLKRIKGFLSQQVITVSTFWIGRYPVTVKEYRACTAASEAGQQGSSPDDMCPVTNVNWHEAVAYCEWLSKITGATFRLPTESEWEFAARGGTLSRNFRFSGGNKPKDVAWFDKNAGGRVHQVGQKMPNELGIFDMSGNVAEWCRDWYDQPSGPEDDPAGPGTGTSRVIRGGSWKNQELQAQVDSRDFFAPAMRLPFVGFRVVMKA